jgi:tripartite-type tricarboxylate transporter receptor subunit TctC
MKLNKRLILCGLLILSLVLVTACGGGKEAEKETFPTKPIKIVIHTSAGGPTDLMGRTVAQLMEPIIGVSCVVENRPGGSGATQMAYVAQAAPDGYTIGAMTPSQLGLLNGNLKDQYKLDDFTWISLSQIDPYIIVVHNDSPFKNLQELVDYAKANPGKINVGGYGSAGAGHNIAWNIFAEKAAIETNWTPYESTGDAVTAILGKHVDVANSNPGQVAQFVETGELRVLGVMADTRLAEWPDVPTYKEAGFDVDTSWNQFRGFYGPKGMPEDVVKVICEALDKVYETDKYKEYLSTSQMMPGGMASAEYTEFINNQDKTTKDWYQKLGVAN